MHAHQHFALLREGAFDFTDFKDIGKAVAIAYQRLHGFSDLIVARNIRELYATGELALESLVRR
jgi:hypothetical protein